MLVWNHNRLTLYFSGDGLTVIFLKSVWVNFLALLVALSCALVLRLLKRLSKAYAYKPKFHNYPYFSTPFALIFDKIPFASMFLLSFLASLGFSLLTGVDLYKIYAYLNYLHTFGLWSGVGDLISILGSSLIGSGGLFWSQHLFGVVTWIWLYRFCRWFLSKKWKF